MTESGILNTLQTTRKPRHRVLVNGTTLLDATRVSVQSQNNYSADRCSVTVVTTRDSKYGFQWFESQADGIVIEIKAGFLADGESEDGDKPWPSIFKGRVDSYDCHYSTNVIEIEARDFSATLADTKTAETFQNSTSSEIATILAGRHGLRADVQATTTAAGVYYKQDHDKISLSSFHKETTEWHLLVYLAQREGFDLWVTGDVLHFKPAVKESAKPYGVYCRYNDNNIMTSNVKDLRLHRDLTKSKDIKVEVKSWNSKQKTSHVYTAGGGSSGKAGKGKDKGEAGTASQTYTFIIPGLSAAEAQAEANKRLAYLTKLERRISYSEPGVFDYTVRDLVLLSGTVADGYYYIDSMSRDLSFDGGFTQHVNAKNHDPHGGQNVG